MFLFTLASRLEDKENEMKGEYNKLHSRYTELLRGHCDLMERVKILIGNEDSSLANSGPVSITSTNALRSFLSRKQEMDQVLETEQRNVNKDITSPAAPTRQWIDTDLSLEDASIIEDVDDIPKDRDREQPPSLTGMLDIAVQNCLFLSLYLISNMINNVSFPFASNNLCSQLMCFSFLRLCRMVLLNALLPQLTITSLVSFCLTSGLGAN